MSSPPTASTSRWPAGCSRCRARATTSGATGHRRRGTWRTPTWPTRSSTSTRCRAAPMARRGCTPSCASASACTSAANGSPGCCGCVGRAGIGGNTHRHRAERPPPRAARRPGAAAVRRRRRRTGCGAPTSPSIPTATGKVYCCAVLDVFSRAVVGWSIADHMRAELVVDALQMATWRRHPSPARSSTATEAAQYTSWVFGHRLREAGLLGSMGRVAQLGRQHHDRVVLVDHAARTARHPPLELARRNSRRRSSSGSRPGTTRAAGTPASAMLSPARVREPFTPPPSPRHDHHTRRVRRTGSGSELAEAADDVPQLNELVDEGNRRAGQFLVARAAGAGDLRELQRLSDADCREADVELRRLLSGDR